MCETQAATLDLSDEGLGSAPNTPAAAEVETKFDSDDLATTEVVPSSSKQTLKEYSELIKAVVEGNISCIATYCKVALYEYD